MRTLIATADVARRLKVSSRTVRRWIQSAIMHLRNTTENRSWRTRYRGPLLIHASLRPDSAARGFMATLGLDVPAVVSRGAILGSVVLVDVVDDSDSPWA